MDTLSKYVGSKIREYRKKKNLTQEELGDRIGVKHNTISAYERGKISPEQDNLFKLAEVLDVNVDSFFPPRRGEESLESVLTKNENLSFEDMLFLKNLIDKVNLLRGEEREKFMDSIRLAVEYFNKFNK